MSQAKSQVPEKGEGNHEADREYRARTERFIAGGGVEEAAEKAKQALDEEGEALLAAEKVGRSRMAEEDPEVRRVTKKAGRT